MTGIFSIRASRAEDLDTLMETYRHAKEFMAANGNPGQWTGGYPSRDLIASEIAALHSFVCEDRDGTVAGTFCFIIGDDPTYSLIEDGAWIGAQATVCPGVTAHMQSILTVGSVATKDMDENCIYQGNPAVCIRKRIIKE